MNNFFLICLSLYSVGIWGQSVVVNGVKYQLNNGAVECYAEKGVSECAVLPQVNIDGGIYNIVEINSSFGVGENHNVNSSNTALRKITLPESIKKIESFAFSHCKSLVNINIPESVTDIGEYAFYDCSSLEAIILPSNLKEISKKTFGQCASLSRINIPQSVETIGEGAFWGCASLSRINIPQSVETIGKGAFSGCVSLTSVTIRAGGIGAEAFMGCTSLEHVEFADNVKWISNGAFSGCKRIKELVLPDSIQLSRGYRKIFEGCESLSEVRGKRIRYPKSFIDSNTIEKDCWGDSPFGSKIGKIRASFSYFAQERILTNIEKWEKRKDFETVSQWQARVTEANRNAKIKEYINEARAAYIEANSPSVDVYKIGGYDTEYGVLEIKAKSNNWEGSCYCKIPMDEVEIFKKKFFKCKKSPVFDVKDDQLALVGCTFKMGKKEYKSPEYVEDESVYALNLPPVQLDLVVENEIPIEHVDDRIDKEIPVVSTSNDKIFAVIIGNENYQKVSKVQFAQNDANIFAAYCQKTLGLPQKNVRVYKDATFATMLAAIDDIKNIAKAYKGDISVIFYYAGHGVPNESSNEAYLLPIDTDGRNTEVCYSVKRLYSELGALDAKSITVFMDACFSGSERGTGMLMSARGVAIKAKAAEPHGNMIVFSAASNDETAYPYKEKGHGLFTYFLLKKLRETKGDVSLGELGDYLIDKVSKESVVSNGKSQTPTVMPSVGVDGRWQSMKLR